MPMTVSFNCRECGAPDNEAEVVVDSAPVMGNLSGPPESCWPGEGAEWHAEEEVKCHACGALHDFAWLDEHLNDDVQERAAEPPEPYCD